MKRCSLFLKKQKKYLSFTNIQNSLVLCKTYEAFELEKKYEIQKALHSHEVALKILKELYSFTRKSSKDTLFTEEKIFSIHTAGKIVRTKTSIGALLNKEKKCENSLQCSHEALVRCIQYNNSLKKIYTDFHPIFKRSKYLMAKLLSNIACSNEQFGNLNYDCAKYSECKEVKIWKDIQYKYEEALKINKKLLSTYPYSKSEKQHRDLFVQKEERKISNIKKRIRNIKIRM